MSKVCCVGVCEGMTWDEAKEFIIKKHDLSFWQGWVNRVKWREFTSLEVKLNKKIKELEQKVAAQYTNTIVAEAYEVDVMEICEKSCAC
jgi:hypothetical protein